MFRVLAVLIALGLAAPASFAEIARPRAGYVVMQPGMGDVAEGAPESRILFLNRCPAGCTVTPGFNDSRTDRSSIVSGTSYLAPFPHGDRSWQLIVDCVRTLYSDFDIDVTDVDPGQTTPHFEAIVAGRASDIGLEVDAGGVSPFECGVIENAITFTFAERLGNAPRLTCEVVGQESAHAFGLDHELLCQDPLTYLTGCGAKCFRDEDALCGEDEPRSCYCGGTTQNSRQRIRELFGERQTTPAVDITEPAPAARVDAGFFVRAEPKVQCVTVVEAWLESADQTIYLGDIHTAPYVFNTPAELASGPVTVRVAVTDVDDQVFEDAFTITVNDGRDLTPPGPGTPGCPEGSCGEPQPPETGGCAVVTTARLRAPSESPAIPLGVVLLFTAVARRRRRAGSDSRRPR